MPEPKVKSALQLKNVLEIL